MDIANQIIMDYNKEMLKELIKTSKSNNTLYRIQSFGYIHKGTLIKSDGYNIAWGKSNAKVGMSAIGKDTLYRVNEIPESEHRMKIYNV